MYLADPMFPVQYTCCPCQEIHIQHLEQKYKHMTHACHRSFFKVREMSGSFILGQGKFWHFDEKSGKIEIVILT